MVVMREERVLPDSYYDDSGYGEGLYDIPMRDGLSWREKKEAGLLETMGRGVMLVTGKPRSGKDLFGVGLSYLHKYYFGRQILLDFKPRRLYGEYELFNAKVMMGEINKMALAAGTDLSLNPDSEETAKTVGKLSEEWIGQHEVLLKGAVLYLSELKRYCYNRHPHNPMNKFIGAICTQWGHLDLLIIGTHIQAHEIDQYSFLNYVTHWAKCTWSITRPNTTDVSIVRGTYLTENGAFDVVRKPIVMHVDGGRPRRFLGDNRLFDLYNTKNMVNLKPVIRKEM